MIVYTVKFQLYAHAYIYAMPPKKRKSYSIEFKLKALLNLAENKNNITKTAKDIGVHRKNVRKEDP